LIEVLEELSKNLCCLASLLLPVVFFLEMHSDVWLVVVIKSGIYYRLTLLLGPPSSGKTTLLLALAGKLDKDLRVRAIGRTFIDLVEAGFLCLNGVCDQS
jgi:hypothetical protein